MKNLKHWLIKPTLLFPLLQYKMVLNSKTADETLSVAIQMKAIEYYFHEVLLRSFLNIGTLEKNILHLNPPYNNDSAANINLMQYQNLRTNVKGNLCQSLRKVCIWTHLNIPQESLILFAVLKPLGNLSGSFFNGFLDSLF